MEESLIPAEKPLDKQPDDTLSEAEDQEAQREEAQEDFEETEVSISKKIEWSEISDQVKPIPFQWNLKLLFESPQNIDNFSPVSLFQLFFDNEVWDLFVEQSNIYLDQLKEDRKTYIDAHPHCRLRKWCHVTRKQLQKWIAMRMLIPLHSNNDLKSKVISNITDILLDNWSSEELFDTKFRHIISEDEFWMISGIFHLADNKDLQSNTEKLHKISKFHEIMQKKWNLFYSMSQNITLDETMIAYSGRLSFLQFIKGKPTRWGIKAFEVASSSSGYVYHLKFYTGKDTEKISTKQLVKVMTEGLESRILFIDNYYTSIELLKSLRKKGIRCTIRKNRIRDISLVKEFSKSEKGTAKFFTNKPDADLILLMCKDTSNVYILSNHRDSSINVIDVEVKGQIITKRIPAIRDHYNSKCRGVDKTNQLCNSYRYCHVQRKWWKAIFEHIFQISLSNLYIIYSHLVNEPMRRNKFHLEMTNYLIHEEKIERPTHLIHYPDWVPEKRKFIDNSKQESETIHISKQMKRDFRLNCRNKNCVKKSDIYCPGCSNEKFVCSLCIPDCFNIYNQTV